MINGNIGVRFEFREQLLLLSAITRRMLQIQVASSYL